MKTSPSLMYAEAASAPELVQAQRVANAPALAHLADSLAQNPVRTVLTLGRGSSDNAATYARYLIERRLGLVTSSMPPSVSALYGAQLDLEDAMVLAISQSGRSPDLIAAMRRAKHQGARITALVNDSSSPLALEADHFIDIAAGAELSVAATKSFVLSLTAVLDLIASICDDRDLDADLDALPRLLDAAWSLDWSAAIEPLRGAQSAYVIARGYGLGIAQELALKLKETCCIHAEAFSAAEVRHGPMALVGKDFPVIVLAQPDEARDDISALARDFAGRGACVMHSGLAIDEGIALPTLGADATIAPLLQLQSFYRLCESLSQVMGFDPDQPPYLSKVTKTL